ncbi:unnamed protein product [Arabidopsis halleri]
MDTEGVEYFHDLSLLNPSITGWYIRVRVERSFEIPITSTLKSMGLILSDEHVSKLIIIQSYSNLIMINFLGFDHVCVLLLCVYTFLLTNKSSFCMFCDKGTTIEAVIGKTFSDHYYNFINLGDWITIMRFRVLLNSNPVRATSHDYKICFLEDTVVRKTADVSANPHRAFVSFSSIIDDTIDTSVLVDLVGAIYDVGPLENIDSDPEDWSCYRMFGYET